MPRGLQIRGGQGVSVVTPLAALLQLPADPPPQRSKVASARSDKGDQRALNGARKTARFDRPCAPPALARPGLCARAAAAAYATQPTHERACEAHPKRMPSRRFDAFGCIMPGSARARRRGICHPTHERTRKGRTRPPDASSLSDASCALEHAHVQASAHTHALGGPGRCRPNLKRGASHRPTSPSSGPVGEEDVPVKLGPRRRSRYTGRPRPPRTLPLLSGTTSFEGNVLGPRHCMSSRYMSPLGVRIAHELPPLE